MKKPLTRALTPLLTIVLLLAGLANAQFVPRIVQVNVPFDFTVGEKAFSAGQYTLVSMAPQRVDLRDARGHVLALLITHSVQSLDKSMSTKLLFSTADGGHALRQIWIRGELIGDELQLPKHPSALARSRSRRPVETASGSK
jgi:hypothetical protein